MRLYILFILFFLCANLLAQQTFEDRFDLGLSKVDDCDRNWVKAYGSSSFQQKEEKGKKFLSVLYKKRIDKTMSFTLSRIIVFPVNIERKDLHIGFETRGHTNFPLSVDITSYDADESALESDTIQVKINTKWKKNVVSVGKGRIAAIKLTITYKGDQDNNQVVDFRNISIRCGKRDMTSTIIKYPIDSTYTVFDKSHIKPLKKSENEFENPIPNIKDIKVIGLGEITHGSNDIKEARNLFVKNLISHHNCKLVLMEVPYELAFLMNLYITGKLDEPGKEKLRRNLDLTFSGMDELEGLLEWIKNYNNSNSKQVKIFGIDNPINQGRRDYPLMDYHLYLFGQEFMRPYLSMFMAAETRQALNKMKVDQVMYTGLNKQDIAFYKYFIADYDNPEKQFSNVDEWWHLDRDLKMFKRLCFLDSLYREEGEKIIILAHSWHVKKTPFTTGTKTEKMLGNYLARFYKDAYFSINFTFGAGTFLQDDCQSFHYTTDTIQIPRARTLESYAFQSGIDFFYFPTDRLIAPPNQMLGISRHKLKSDYNDFGNVKKRYDAIVFLRNVTAINRHGYDSFSGPHFYSKDREKEYDELIKKMENDSVPHL
ncbi:erythromycin esterase family protein [Sphingobacterium thalpophilum]|uniref:Erythromycin esterase family protein n=1 Tax=Sphingobacterium thalpophilum TaxID=259 RepID=A0ABV4HH12_9SPHI